MMFGVFHCGQPRPGLPGVRTVFQRNEGALWTDNYILCKNGYTVYTAQKNIYYTIYTF